MKAKALINELLLKYFLIILKVLILTNGNENDVQFDFNKYFKVNVATNKPTVFEKMVTLYNPHVWPGPNDTHHSSTTTPMPSRRPNKAKFVFGLRRSAAESRNQGYGYDYNITQPVPPVTPYPSVEYTPTIDTYNRKFYDLNFNQINNNTAYNRYNTSRNFTRFRSVPTYRYGYRQTARPVWTVYNITHTVPDYQHLSPDYYPDRTIVRVQNFSQDFPYYPNLSRDLSGVRNFTLQTISNQTSNTSFRCEYMRYFGYYADVSSNCRVFHVCTPDGRKASFVCPNGLLFNQKLTVCDWRYNVECERSVSFYDTNLIKFDNWNRLLFSKK
ncbi:unnamed protein product [Oppiella nova]|uniref:Chitin-binding type-2 domain-containing protein n=1 Tax=Oppiella nova TaxID=334625 RepID=A0A7R9M745_9ACAR|nr:unnamed protein product [Oppiella nova]CAG2170832.1 unnamed protein product [Oppiella nova]